MFQYNGKERQTELGLNWMDYGARMYDAQLGRFHSIDADADNYYGWTPYNYVGSNPISRTDPDGNNGWDVIKGVAVAALDNATGINLRESVSFTDARDFNRGQDTGDLGSMAVGAILTFDGASNIAAGGAGLAVAATAEVATLGGATPVAAPTAAVSAGLLAKGTAEVGAGQLLMSNGGDNLKNQKGRVKEGNSSSGAERPSKVEKSKTVEKVGGKYTKTTEVRPSGKQSGQSRAEYVRVKNPDGKTIKTYKDSYDKANKFQHRKPLTGGPEGRPRN